MSRTLWRQGCGEAAGPDIIKQAHRIAQGTQHAACADDKLMRFRSITDTFRQRSQMSSTLLADTLNGSEPRHRNRCTWLPQNGCCTDQQYHFDQTHERSSPTPFFLLGHLPTGSKVHPVTCHHTITQTSTSHYCSLHRETSGWHSINSSSSLFIPQLLSGTPAGWQARAVSI